MEQHAAYVRTGHHSATSGEWRDADGLVGRRVPAAHEPGRRAEPSRSPGDPEPRPASGRSGREVAGARRAPAMGRAALPRRHRHADPGPKLAALGLVLVKQEDGNGFDIGGIEQADDGRLLQAERRRGRQEARADRRVRARPRRPRAGPGRAVQAAQESHRRDPRSEGAPAEADRRAGSRSRPALARRVDAHRGERERPAPGDAAGGGSPLRRRAGAEQDAERSGASPGHPDRRCRGAAPELHVDARETDLGTAPGARRRCRRMSTPSRTSRRWRTTPSAARPSRGRRRCRSPAAPRGADCGHGDHPDSAGAGRGRRCPARPAQGRHQHLPAAR